MIKLKMLSKEYKGLSTFFKNTFYFILLLFFIAFLNIGGCSGGGTITIDDPETSGLNKLNVEIIDAFISENRRVTVTLNITDELGNPLSSNDINGINFIIARIVAGGEFIDYVTRVQKGAVQASSESGTQTITDMGGGLFEYIFETILPANYDQNAIHRVALYANRMVGILRWVSNATFDFVPSGGSVAGVRDIVAMEDCNSCHNPLAIHGGNRRDVKLCITCHTSQIIDPDTGETLDHVDPDTGNNIGLKIMAHKIHYGAELPSVQDGTPYQIVGFRDSVHDYSMAEFPQNIKNCTKCHTDAASQGNNYKNNPTRAACGSCHDDVDFSTGENHPVVQLTDNNCSGCHIPDSGNEFDISVVGAHTVLLKSRDLPGMNFNIVSVRSSESGASRVRPGEHVEVTYSIKTDSGDVINPMDMDSISLVIAGPTLDYDIQDYNGDGVRTPGEENVLRERPANSSIGPDASGNFTYTFDDMIPNDASGTYAIGIEGRIERTVGGEGLILRQDVEEAGRNVVKYFPVTDTVAEMRRLVVDNSVEDDFCTSCHGEFSKDFSIHGNLRNNTEYCVLCHNASNDDINRRPVDGGSAVTTSINFREMIHKIHTGEELTIKPYIIYGFGGTPHEFSNIVFPGATNDCDACHIRNTNILDPGTGILGEGILATLTRLFSRPADTNIVQNTFSLEPVITVCTSCHDNLPVNTIGDALTGENHIGGPQPEEACTDCHIAGSPLGAQEVHLIPLPTELRINRPQ